MSNIHVVVSVDWEGRSLLDENVHAMKAFRAAHPDVPMQQFLNAAYYTKEDADIPSTTNKILSTLLPEDEHALHLHAWNSLFELAGVVARKQPSMLEMSEQRQSKIKLKNREDWEFYKNDWGYDVPINKYSAIELFKVIQTSNKILMSHGFRQPRSFRAGGGMGGGNLLEALTQSQFTVDASASNIRFFRQRFGNIPLIEWMGELWAHIHDCSQPYKESTANGDIWQVPSNGCVADYTTEDDIIDVFKKNVVVWEHSKGEDVFVSIGFHQETAARFLDRINKAIVEIRKISSRQGLPVVFTASPIKHLSAP